jgi:hypothetical protein
MSSLFCQQKINNIKHLDYWSLGMDNAVDNLFEALFALTDLRVLLRETAPSHKLSAEQQIQARDALARAKAALSKLEEELQE